jgi:hypothetical protein
MRPWHREMCKGNKSYEVRTPEIAPKWMTVISIATQKSSATAAAKTTYNQLTTGPLQKNLDISH